MLIRPLDPITDLALIEALYVEAPDYWLFAEGAAPGQGVMLDASHLISLDTTGLDTLEQLHKVLERKGSPLGMEGVQEQPRSLIERSGFAQRLHTFSPVQAR